jgi:hypothetical protein
VPALAPPELGVGDSDPVRHLDAEGDFPGIIELERRALRPDLLQRNDDSHRMEAREGRDGPENAVNSTGRPGNCRQI